MEKNSTSENGNEIKVETRGRPAEKIMMNVNCFKNLCLIAQTEQAKKIHKYYVKLESIIFQHMNDELITKDLIISNKEKENENLKNQIELSKRTKEERGFIYIAGDMKDNRKIYKVGQTLDKNKRLSTLNTSHSDNTFVFYEIYETHNRILSEQLIHTYLENQGYRYKKEFFDIELTELLDIVTLFISIVNNIFESDNKNDNIRILLEKIRNPKGINKEEIQNLVKEEIQKQPKLDITINYNFYDYEVYKSFIVDKLAQIKDSLVMTKQLLDCFENYTKEKAINSKNYIKGGGAQSYYYDKNFKDEFVKILETELNSKQIKLKKEGEDFNNKRGFRNVSIKD